MRLRPDVLLVGVLSATAAADLAAQRTDVLVSTEWVAQHVRDGDLVIIHTAAQKSDYDAGHIPGAIHVENGRLPGIDLAPFEGRPLVVHCGTYNRSTAGLSVLARRGLRDLSLLDGGFSAWASSGFEIERDTGEP